MRLLDHVSFHSCFPKDKCDLCMYVCVCVGPAAILAKHCMTEVEVLEYPELGMEAVWKIDGENFPAFIVVDDKGDDFYSKWIP